MSKKLVLLDTMALIYRAHFALARSPRFSSSGLCTSAVFGVTNTLFDLIRREEPTHLAAAVDTSEPTARHAEFAEYKAQRDAMPEDIANQLPWIDRLFEAFNITVIRIPGFEADDIIGTLAKQASQDSYKTLMVTPDKDYDQLVDEKIQVWKPGRKGSEFELVGVPEVLDKWGVEHVEQVIDVLGLMGDSSDNIPGVPGIGPKTAQKLIAQYGSIESLIEHSSELKGKQRERVEEHVEQALLSKRLVTIQLDVPHDIQLDALAWKTYDEKRLKRLFQELEFDSLGKRIFGNSFSSAESRTEVVREQRSQSIQAELFPEESDRRRLTDVAHRYQLVREAKEIQALVERLNDAEEFCFDLETASGDENSTALDARSALPLGIAISLRAHEAYWVDMQADNASQVLDAFRPVLENERIRKIGHNLKYDYSVLKWQGVDVRGPVFDTMLAHAMAEPEMQHKLDYLAELYLNYETIRIEQLIGPAGSEQRELTAVSMNRLVDYACEDADITLQLAEVLRREVEKQGVTRVCHEVECPLVPVLVDMEYQGIRLDTPALATFSQKLEAEIKHLREGVFEVAGHEFNLDSPKQLGVVLYEELQLEPNPKKTATGQYSTRESELERLATRHPVVSDILEYRNAVKLKSVYVDQLPNAVNPKTGRVHTHYNQIWTSTGRLQSKDPNLQTIPIRKKRGREIRAAFVPRDDDYLILSADYSQIELRIMAELSGDEAMQEAFRQGTDIHAMTASKVFGVEVDRVTREMRSKAKAVNFGIIYGVSAFGLQQSLNIPRSEAAALIDSYFAEYPGVRKYIDATIEFAKQHGFVQTEMGRKRFLRDINSRSRGVASAAERLAMNSPIQGTAADILKLAMVRVHNALRDRGFQTKMLLTVHDEIVFDLFKSEREEVVPVIRRAMTEQMPVTVPLEVEIGVGENWLAAH
jgi:DNA polymerase I